MMTLYTMLGASDWSSLTESLYGEGTGVGVGVGVGTGVITGVGTGGVVGTPIAIAVGLTVGDGAGVGVPVPSACPWPRMPVRDNRAYPATRMIEDTTTNTAVNVRIYLRSSSLSED